MSKVQFKIYLTVMIFNSIEIFNNFFFNQFFVFFLYFHFENRLFRIYHLSFAFCACFSSSYSWGEIQHPTTLLNNQTICCVKQNVCKFGHLHQFRFNNLDFYHIYMNLSDCIIIIDFTFERQIKAKHKSNWSNGNSLQKQNTKWNENFFNFTRAP